jgi:aminopeptidase N
MKIISNSSAFMSILIRNYFRAIFCFQLSVSVIFEVNMSFKFLTILVVLSLSSIGSAIDNHRLPNTTIPIHYTIWLTTYIDSGENTFSGEVTILIEVLENTPEIVVHSQDLAITNVYLFDENMEIIEYNLETSIREDLNFVIATPKKPLVKGKRYRVFFSYIGSAARNDGKGFFKSSYVDDEYEEKSWSGTFQAAPIYARQLFPCFDEPQMKSRFLLKVMHGKDYRTISNMPVNITTSYQDTSTITWFKETDLISVSEIGFVVSNFDFVEDATGLFPVRIYAKTKSIRSQEANFAITTAGKCLEVFENLLKIPLPLHKMDFVAVKNPASGKQK